MARNEATVEKFDQKKVMGRFYRDFALGTGMAVGVGVIGYYFIPEPSTALDTIGRRFFFTLRWQTVGALTVVAGVNLVGYVRRRTPAIDPLAPGSDKTVETATRFLQNTVEQFLLNAFGQLIASAYLSAQTIRIIPVACLNFAIGRFLFWRGYTRQNPMKRIRGFAMCFSPMMALYAFIGYKFITEGNGFLMWK